MHEKLSLNCKSLAMHQIDYGEWEIILANLKGICKINAQIFSGKDFAERANKRIELHYTMTTIDFKKVMAMALWLQVKNYKGPQ